MYFSDLESRLVNAEAANNSLQRKNVALAETKSALERDLDDKELQINAHKRDQQKSSRKLKTQLSQQEVIFQLLELYLKTFYVTVCQRGYQGLPTSALLTSI